MENQTKLELWISDIKSKVANLDTMDIDEKDKKYIINSVKSLELYNEKRTKYKKPVISVTGTCGKTTTCKMIYDILKNVCKIDKSGANSNSFVGIPYTVNTNFSLDSDLWLIEIGIGGKNQMNKLVELVKPNIRILTNVLVSHTDENFSAKQYQNEKIKFLENLPDNTIVIINNDDNIISKLKFDDNITVIKCGTKSNNNIQLLSHRINNDNISSDVTIKINNNNNKLKLESGSIINIRLNSINYHNAMNACLAIGCAKYFYVPDEIIIQTFDNFNFYVNRGLIVSKPNYTLYDYTYNCVHNALMANLKSFKNIKNTNKVIIIGFENFSQRIIDMFYDISKNITSNIIFYIPTDNISKSKIDKYNIFNDTSDILFELKRLIKLSGNISIFIQGSSNLLLTTFVQQIKNQL